MVCTRAIAVFVLVLVVVASGQSRAPETAARPAGEQKSEPRLIHRGSLRKQARQHDGYSAAESFAKSGSTNTTRGDSSQIRHEVFCYSLVTEKEETVKDIAHQLSISCDGFALFGVRSDSSLHLVRAYTPAQNDHGWANQMREQVVLGAWGHLQKTGILDQYRWLLKVDADSFLRPSTLRTALLAHGDSGAAKIYTVGYPDLPPEMKAGPDGFFVAIPHTLFPSLLDASKKSSDCDQMLSGHSNGKSDAMNFQMVKRCEKMLGQGELVADFLDSSGRQLVLVHPECGLGLGEKCGLGRECSRFSLPKEVSPQFVSVHGVKSAECYEELVKRFP